MPAYYRSVLVINELLLAVYFLVNEFMILWRNRTLQILPAVMFVLMVLSVWKSSEMSMRMNVAAYTVITIVWCGWYIYNFGWGCGGQHLLIPMLAINFFNIYETPWLKVINAVSLIIYRILLYSWSLRHVPVFALDQTTNIIFQTLNSLLLFIILSIDFIIFSSSIQETERQLRLNNQELHKEADTDPLTRLPNRRAMLDYIDMFRMNFPKSPFTVAIGDLDLFKNINDTYGHNCGDYALKELAGLFKNNANDDYKVCRWGGEEFCFFLPGKNIDEAWNVMFGLCEAVRKMPLSFDGNDFSITITIGIEENDFQSSIESILERADKKLYMGKVAGRNRVVM